MFWVLVGLLDGAGQPATPPEPPPPAEVTTGGSWGFWHRPRKTDEDEREEAQEAVQEAVQDAIEAQPAPKRVQITIRSDAEIIASLPPLNVAEAIREAAEAYAHALAEDDEDALSVIVALL